MKKILTSYASIFCLRFDYGLPLEDISPPDDIHPNLNRIFLTGYEAIRRTGESIEDILKNYQNKLHQRLKIKEDFVHTQQLLPEKILPGTFLWLIRHFLGLLPLPLFPTLTCNRTYDWANLSIKCKYYFQKLPRTDEFELNCGLASLICDFPKSHVMFLHTFIVFLRSLCISRLYPTKFSRKNLSCLVKYFTASMFIRPYQPGFITKKEKQYHALVYYMIIKWFGIFKQMKNTGHPEVYIDLKRQHFYKPYSTDTNMNVFKGKSHASTQTEELETDSNISQLDLANLMNDQIIVSDIETFKNTCSQTDSEVEIGGSQGQNAITKKHQSNIVAESDKVTRRIYFEECHDTLSRLSEEIEIKIIDYVDTRNYHEQSEKNESNTEEENDNLDQVGVSRGYYGWIKPNELLDNSQDNNFIDDDYDTFETEEYNQISAKVYCSITAANSKEKPIPNLEKDYPENVKIETFHDGIRNYTTDESQNESCSPKSENTNKSKRSFKELLHSGDHHIGWRYIPSLPSTLFERKKDLGNVENCLVAIKTSVEKDVSSDHGDSTKESISVDTGSASNVTDQTEFLKKLASGTNIQEISEERCKPQKRVREFKLLGLNYVISKFMFLRRIQRNEPLLKTTSHHSRTSIKYRRMPTRSYKN